jgi:hypothetical protein
MDNTQEGAKEQQAKEGEGTMFIAHLKQMKMKINNGGAQHSSLFFHARHNNVKGSRKAQRANKQTNDQTIFSVSHFVFRVLSSCFVFYLHF